MPAHPDRILISHARVVSCSGDPTERPVDGDVLIEGDRIAGVFPGRAPVDPASVREVDVAGATVLPGLCDAHTHISWPLDFVFDHPEIAAMPEDEHALEVAAVVRTYLRWGYTLLVGAGALKPRVDVVIQRAIDHGRIDGPRLWPSGDMITQRGAIGSPTLTEVGDADEMRRAVARQCELGVRVIKLMVSGDGIVPGHPSQVTYMDDAMVGAAVREAEAHGAFVTAHARGPGGVRLAVRNGVRIVAGGDFGHQWTRHGTYAAELAAYVELVGFSPLEALLTATANAGPLVGEPLGRIAEGHLADLVVVDGDPTSDVRVLLDGDRVGPVVKGGVPASVPGWRGVEHWAHERRVAGRAADETAPPAAGRAGDEG